MVAAETGSLVAGDICNTNVFVGNDAGVAHLTAALGTPTVAIFGPTDPRVWAPRGRGPVSIVEAPGGDLERLSPDRVAAAVIDCLTAGRALG